MRHDIYFGDRNYRFALGKSGERPLVVVGVNPNTADSFKDDPTIRKIEEQLQVWKEFDGFLMFNLYPVRESKPERLDRFDIDLTVFNASVIQHLLKRISNPIVWAAWGDGFDSHPFFGDCLHEIQVASTTLNVHWCKCETLTQKNNPRHPLAGRRMS